MSFRVLFVAKAWCRGSPSGSWIYKHTYIYIYTSEFCYWALGGSGSLGIHSGSARDSTSKMRHLSAKMLKTASLSSATPFETTLQQALLARSHLSRVPPHPKPPCNTYYLLENTPLEATSLETPHSKSPCKKYYLLTATPLEATSLE